MVSSVFTTTDKYPSPFDNLPLHSSFVKKTEDAYFSHSIVSDLEALNLIHAALQLAANHSSASCRQPSDELNSIPSSTKCRHMILGHQSHLPLGSFLSSKIINRISDKGLSWQGPTSTGNESQTLIMVVCETNGNSNRPNTPYS